MEKYLTTKELSAQIKMKPGTIRNMISQGIFQLNVHYVKPNGGRVLFIWSAVESWMLGRPVPNQATYRIPQKAKSIIDRVL